MRSMGDSMAYPSANLRTIGWREFVGTAFAWLLAALFLVAGVWKVTDPFGAATRLTQALVPEALSLPGALLLGTVEIFAAILLLLPNLRRWGALLTGLLLLAFMVYIGVFYQRLQGEECNCFPFIKRAVGPGFFIGDAIMLALAGAAYAWSRTSAGLRTAAGILLTALVFTGVSFGVAKARMTGTVAPASITVDGQTMSLQTGKALLYFFDPECLHCFDVAKKMSRLKWDNTKIIAVPYAQPRFAQNFLRDTGLKASVSNDIDLLHRTFKKVEGPHAVAVEHGRQKAFFTQFEGDAWVQQLRELEFVQ